MPITVKALLRTSKLRADGTGPIWIRITANRKSRFISTGISVEPKYWNKARAEVRKSHDIATSLNQRLRAMVLKARQEALEATNATAVKSALRGTGGNLTSYLESIIEGLDASEQYWHRKKYATTLRKVRGCFGQDVSWKDIDRAALIKFERYLRQKVGNGPNTVRKEFDRLQRVFKKAVQDGELSLDRNPFLFYDKPKGEKVCRRKLNLDEINALEVAELDAGSWAAMARDAFVFAFYAGGMRFGDVCHLNPENVKGARLEYRMMKTGTMVSMPLPEPAQRIAEHYQGDRGSFLFPFLRERNTSTAVKLRQSINSCNVLANKGLKQAGLAAGLEPEGLSMHIARHSFADYARTKSSNLYAISKTLGHTDIKTTQQYLKSFDQDAVDQLADELWR